MKSIFNKEYKDLISKLRHARVRKGISQKALADKLGYSQSYISKIEQGQIRLDVIQLKEISNALGVDVKRLMG